MSLKLARSVEHIERAKVISRSEAAVFEVVEAGDRVRSLPSLEEADLLKLITILHNVGLTRDQELVETGANPLNEAGVLILLEKVDLLLNVVVNHFAHADL